eukprot:GHVT01007155.1.p1 GENE.GHVT01007155.1~~GHVT01007155.1.p1  ORF type:complete len:221 (+),score=44.90 GHVT01007155.1:263-925(+)
MRSLLCHRHLFNLPSWRHMMPARCCLPFLPSSSSASSTGVFSRLQSSSSTASFGGASALVHMQTANLWLATSSAGAAPCGASVAPPTSSALEFGGFSFCGGAAALRRPAAAALWPPRCRGLVEMSFARKRKTSQEAEKQKAKPPFQVARTPSGNLPVYARIRRGGLQVTTILRHCFGDVKALRQDLMNVCEAPVRERLGSLEVKGLHTIKIKQWLKHTGF